MENDDTLGEDITLNDLLLDIMQDNSLIYDSVDDDIFGDDFTSEGNTYDDDDKEDNDEGKAGVFSAFLAPSFGGVQSSGFKSPFFPYRYGYGYGYKSYERYVKYIYLVGSLYKKIAFHC